MVPRLERNGVVLESMHAVPVRGHSGFAKAPFRDAHGAFVNRKKETNVPNSPRQPYASPRRKPAATGSDPACHGTRAQHVPRGGALPCGPAEHVGTFSALSGSTLGPALGEQIAVAVANRNACEYCLAAHVSLGVKAGLAREALDAAQSGRSDDPRTAAVLQFALELVEHRGQVPASHLQALRDLGLDNAQIVEVIAHVALNLFTNYVNVALQVPTDFPEVSLR